MDIIVQRELLLKPLQAVSGVVEKKQTLPILSNILLATQDNKLSLTGTDLEIELIGFVPIETMQSPGAITVSARKLFDICRTLPDGVLVRLTLEKNHLIVRASDSRFVLNTLPTEDFPNLEDCEYETSFSLRQIQLKNLFSRTHFAMGQQDVRHYLNGAYLDVSSNMVKCVAADGHRLALTTIHDEMVGDVNARVILPRKSVLELIRLIHDNEAEATIMIGKNRFKVLTSDWIFTSKLISAQYPDYNRLIPTGSTVAVGERDVIKQALVRASILSNEKFRGVRFALEASKLCITANNSDQEQAEEAVHLDYAGENLEIGFNVAYLLDVLSAISAKMIRFVFTDPNSGVLIESGDGDQSLYVVMPMIL